MTRHEARQAVFDQAMAHLRKQGRASIRNIGTADEVCAFRGDGGRKCSIGAQIPDEWYSPGIEGKRASDVLHLLPADVAKAGGRFLNAVQNDLHDDLAEFEGADFQHRLEDVGRLFAEEYDLIFPIRGNIR